jgi:hypothetical protein
VILRERRSRRYEKGMGNVGPLEKESEVYRVYLSIVLR